MADFPYTDRRHSSLFTGNADAELNRLRAGGYTMPKSNRQARIEAKRVVSDLKERGTVADVQNRAAAAAMRQEKFSRASARGASGAMTRTAANTQMVLPKTRQPLGSLMDKGIPFNTQDPKELIELRRWCRLFQSTHDLVPLLIDIYSTFPVVGMEFDCSKDKKIEQFYESMFMDELNYEEFLPNGLLREYFTVGEATSLAHFNEQLGIWSSEELLNPDMIRVSKSLFVEQERVQLLVKDLVESLRSGPQGMAASEESPSEKLERTHELQMLTKHYPEIIKAAAQDDGLDISDALVSRLVNKAAWWDLRGTPHLLRSFRTLLLEESLNMAQDSVCDRLYAPMVLATLGIENMGDGEPWIPDQGELEDLRDDIQSALAADFKLLCHNMGLQVTSVFGRESVPRFDTDYDRVDAKLMQAWGIGQALIMGGTGAGGTYASSAINREVCEQLMKGAQRKVIRHMRKRMEVIAEAQEHYDFEMKGSLRKPIYREVVQYNEETGEEEIIRVPKLLIPDVKFATLNLRDEATERSFISQLKQLGVPISDKALAVNIPFDFKTELERQSQETIDKGMAQAEATFVLQEMCDEKGYPYPAELNQTLQTTLQTRALLAQTEMAEGQNKMLDQQIAQASPAGMMGLLPGTTMQPLAGSGAVAPPGDPTGGQAPEGEPPDPAAQGAPTADPTLGAGAPMPGDPSNLGYGQLTATAHGPRMFPPRANPPGGPVSAPDEMDPRKGVEVPKNWQSRPPESDEMRTEMPKKANLSMPGKGEYSQPPRPHRTFGRPPSSYKLSHKADDQRVEAAISRRQKEATGNHPRVADLIRDPNFYAVCNAQADQHVIEADFPAIVAGQAPEAARLLDELLEMYEEATGIRPYW